jgi:TetR/AcrR family transcriptional repressor of mexJK operon
MDVKTIVPSRREANRRSRRELILDVAQGSFLDHGYDGTTMSGIATQLGGSKGTLWSYFPSKEGLFAAVVDRATEDFRKQLTVILNPDEGLEIALRRFCEQFLVKVTSEDAVALHRLVVGETSRFPELGRIFYDRAPRQTHLLLAEFIAGAQSRGALQGIEPLRAAQQLTWLCMSGCYQMRLTGVIDYIPPDVLAGDIDAAMVTFMRAYGATGMRA